MKLMAQNNTAQGITGRFSYEGRDALGGRDSCRPLDVLELQPPLFTLTTTFQNGNDRRLSAIHAFVLLLSWIRA